MLQLNKPESTTKPRQVAANRRVFLGPLLARRQCDGSWRPRRSRLGEMVRGKSWLEPSPEVFRYGNLKLVRHPLRCLDVLDEPPPLGF